MTPAPTPQPAHDHGAAGFCTDHAPAPDERTETVARVLREHQRCRCCEGCQTCPSIDVPIDQHQAAAVVAALGRSGAGFWPALAGQNDRDAWAFMAERDAARAALDRVRALHRPAVDGETGSINDGRCVVCVDFHADMDCEQQDYPCPTVRALDPEGPR